MPTTSCVPGDMHAQAQHFLEVADPARTISICADHEDTGVSLDDLREFLGAIWALTKRQAVIYSGHVLKEQVGEGHITWLRHAPTMRWRNTIDEPSARLAQANLAPVFSLAVH